MGRAIDELTIEGFKSIKELKGFKLGKLNILIGANGSGKSNFVDFFRMLRAFADKSFQEFVNEQGGGDAFFFQGPKRTPEIKARLDFRNNWYEFTLKPTADGSLQITSEVTGYLSNTRPLVGGNRESNLSDNKNAASDHFRGYKGIPAHVYDAVSSWIVYHFYDTSSLAPMRRRHEAADYDELRSDAANIAPFLANLQEDEPGSYSLIRDTVRLIAPFFDDFTLRPRKQGDMESLSLEWKQKSSSFPFQPSQLSDGTIRFICLATALLQPNMPGTVVIDEPELGLHPYAISILAALIQSASERTQVIVSTQSVTLLDYFDPDEIIVVNRSKGASTFDRLDETSLEAWLGEYTVGDLWEKNIVQAGPSNE